MGSLSQFQSTLSKYASVFEQDRTYTLIVRLRQNVIKTGIRRLSLSYSRISLRDICVKLHLDSEEDAEYIVGKAIRDGVIEGRIVHEKGWMECGSQKGGYGPEVSDVFSRRIQYCLELHNQSVKVSRTRPRSEACADFAFVRLCDTRSMHTARSSPRQRVLGSVRRSWRRSCRRVVTSMTRVPTSGRASENTTGDSCSCHCTNLNGSCTTCSVVSLRRRGCRPCRGTIRYELRFGMKGCKFVLTSLPVHSQACPCQGLRKMEHD